MDKLVARSTVFQEFVGSENFPITAGPIKISEQPLCGIVRIQGRASDPAFSAGVTSALRVALPGPESLSPNDDAVLAWAGPNEYLWFCDLQSEDKYTALLTGALAGQFANVTLVSDSRLGFLVMGNDARSFLAKGCSVDMHPAAFRTGHVVTTRFAGLPAMLLCRTQDQFVVYFDIGYAQYILKWILDAAEEFMVTLPPKNESLAECVNSSKEKKR